VVDRVNRLAAFAGLGVGLMTCSWAWAEPCASSVTAFEVAQLADAVERSWLEMNVDNAKASNAELVAALPCLAGALTPRQAAQVHRAFGLVRIVERDLEGAAVSFAAARYADPGLGVSEALAPSGTPVRELFVRPLAFVPAVELRRPRSGLLIIDGTATEERPGARPIVLQHVDRAGIVVGTWLVAPGAPMPEQPWADPRRPVRTGLQVGAAGLAVTSVSLLGAAALTAARHEDQTRTSLTVDDLNRLRERSHRLTVASGVLGAAAASSFGLSLSGVFR
jgi:hypothetical protein